MNTLWSGLYVVLGISGVNAHQVPLPNLLDQMLFLKDAS